MKAKFHIKLTSEDLVQKLLDTGVTDWNGSYISHIIYNENADDVWGEEVHIQTDIDEEYSLHKVPVHKLLEAFNEFVHKMSFTVTDGELEDLDFDAAVADEILQTAVFGEVVYA